MSKIKLKILENTFTHCDYSNNPMPPVSFSDYVEWDRDVSDEEELVFYTDVNIDRPRPGHKRRIAWLIEPYVKQSHRYERLLNNSDAFEYVLVNDKKLLDADDKFIYYPFGGCWIEVVNRRTNHNKTKLVSIIASGKKNVVDHHKRHEIVSKYNDIIDVMGRGYTPIEPISVGLMDYMFHIAMENESRDYHFSEKLIGDYFDTRGMLIFNEVDEMEYILNSLNDDLYKDMMPYAKENFEIAKQYVLSEDWMYENIFKQMSII